MLQESQYIFMFTRLYICLNRANKNAQTPLHVAAENGQTEVVHLLLMHGADDTLMVSIYNIVQAVHTWIRIYFFAGH